MCFFLINFQLKKNRFVCKNGGKEQCPILIVTVISKYDLLVSILLKQNRSTANVSHLRAGEGEMGVGADWGGGRQKVIKAQFCFRSDITALSLRQVIRHTSMRLTRYSPFQPKIRNLYLLSNLALFYNQPLKIRTDVELTTVYSYKPHSREC